MTLEKKERMLDVLLTSLKRSAFSFNDPSQLPYIGTTLNKVHADNTLKKSIYLSKHSDIDY